MIYNNLFIQIIPVKNVMELRKYFNIKYYNINMQFELSY